jgi:hypothetical protein
MYDCKECMEFFVRCPCCNMEFCPSCEKTERDEEDEEEAG